MPKHAHIRYHSLPQNPPHLTILEGNAQAKRVEVTTEGVHSSLLDTSVLNKAKLDKRYLA